MVEERSELFAAASCRGLESRQSFAWQKHLEQPLPVTAFKAAPSPSRRKLRAQGGGCRAVVAPSAAAPRFVDSRAACPAEGERSHQLSWLRLYLPVAHSLAPPAASCPTALELQLDLQPPRQPHSLVPGRTGETMGCQDGRVDHADLIFDAISWGDGWMTGWFPFLSISCNFRQL